MNEAVSADEVSRDQMLAIVDLIRPWRMASVPKVRIGNEFVFSGIWWIALFPALTLVVLVLAVNVVGDWLRDRFNPKLRGKG